MYAPLPPPLCLSLPPSDGQNEFSLLSPPLLDFSCPWQQRSVTLLLTVDHDLQLLLCTCYSAVIQWHMFRSPVCSNHVDQCMIYYPWLTWFSIIWRLHVKLCSNYECSTRSTLNYISTCLPLSVSECCLACLCGLVININPWSHSLAVC